MIWNGDFECLDLEELKKQQLVSLVRLVETVSKKAPFYREKLDKAGIKASDIQDLKDIVMLPFTTKEEMRTLYPYGLLAVDESEIVEVHISSGTTRTPVVDAYTSKNIEIWSESMARTLAMTGTTKDDVVQNAYGYGLFTGGLGIHYGARKIGASIIPTSAGNTRRQITLIRPDTCQDAPAAGSYG